MDTFTSSQQALKERDLNLVQSQEDDSRGAEPSKNADFYLKVSRDTPSAQYHSTYDQNQTSSSEDNFQSVSPAKSSDLFLKIARDSAAAHETSASARDSTTTSRRSRISLPFLSTSRPATSMKSSPMSTHFDSETPAPPPRLGKRSSLGPHVPGALTSSPYYADTRSHVGIPVDRSSNIDTSDSRSLARSRRHSNANPETTRPPTRSYQARSRLASESLYADRFRMQEQTKTESTISTTAPSTVWDELDDLKSRIKKLELTGKIPSSSAAAMASSSERPRTATTQATTMSSSPKHRTASIANQLPSAIEGISSSVHPTLHEALSNAKASLSNDVFQKLQATATDALQLSTMMSHEYNSATNMTPQLERQMRRRTESMCRSLTELTIALLADQRPVTSPASRPGSRDQFATSQLRSRRRSSSTTEPTELPQVTSRVVSRRTSLANKAQEPSPRPVSRAMTEAPTSYRQVPNLRASNFSREYTRQHPLPVNGTDKASTPTQGQFIQRRTAANTPSAASPAVNSSPVPFTISIERGTPRSSTLPESPASVVSEASPGVRAASGRRSLGFAARVSSVSSRLKAARDQRLASAAARGSDSVVDSVAETRSHV
jgi:hypothetical protein